MWEEFSFSSFIVVELTRKGDRVGQLATEKGNCSGEKIYSVDAQNTCVCGGVWSVVVCCVSVCCRYVLEQW